MDELTAMLGEGERVRRFLWELPDVVVLCAV
jgi:hypothetical protein